MGTGLGTFIPVAILIAVLASAALALAGRPRPAMVMLLLLIPLQTTRERLQVFPLGAQVIDILWISVFIGMLVHGRLGQLPHSPVYRWLLALGLFTYLSLWLGSFALGADLPLSPSNPRLADWKNYMVMPLICVSLCGALRTKRDLQLALFTMFVATALVDWSFFRSTSGRDFSHFSYQIRDAGVLGYAGVNGFAAFIASSLVFWSVFLFVFHRNRVLIPVLALLGFSTYCLLFSFSRGAYFATLGGLAMGALFRFRFLLIALAALLLTWQSVLPTAVQERINMTYGADDGGLEPSAGDRVLLWQDAMELYSSNPVLGIGFDTYSSMHRVAEYGDTHNYYVKMLVETGTAGLALLVGLILRLLFIGISLYRKPGDTFCRALGLAFACMMLCSAISNFFGDRWTYLQVDGYLWVTLACVIRAFALHESPSREEAGSCEKVYTSETLTPVSQGAF
jgi:putative inorganic carbon (HCO3(-)) transporter